MADDFERQTLTRVAWRLIPFLILCYFVAYLDRVNVGFAKLTMDPDLKLSETAFGFGAGVFFLAYFVFEVPSNIVMDKVGARRWIARIMLSWSVVSGAVAFIPSISQATGLKPEHTLYAPRILLGAAEAGSFPALSSSSPCGSPRPTGRSSSAILWRPCRSPPRSARPSPPSSSVSTAHRACAVGSGCSSWRRCPRSSSESSPSFTHRPAGRRTLAQRARPQVA
ncbi:MAG TPA: MFS transporter [Roseiarcus sp.]|nr:MFS transporter [Roseiarcus sp.]